MLFGEPHANAIAAALAAAAKRIMSAATLVETAIVIEARKGPAGAAELDAMIARLSIEIAPVTEEQALTARLAWRRFGKGRHAAGLNFGDCFAYALSRTADAPLLAAGNDFPKTDIELVAV